MHFGNNIRTGLKPQNTMYSMNSSLFKLDGNFGNNNIFKGVNNSQSFNFNGVNYDNAYAMLNFVGDGSANNGGQKDGGINFGKIIGFAGKVGSMLDKGLESLGKFGKKIGDAAKKAANGLKEGINKLFGKKDANKAGGTANKALEDLKNAQDKEALTQALDGAKTEQQANTKQAADAEKGQKAAQKGQADAKKSADASQKKLDGDNKQLDQDNEALGQAKDGVATAKEALEAATQGVTSAEEKLQAAKDAANEKNPNTAAINAAEQEVRAAKEQEAKAKDDLAAAEKTQTESEKKVEDQTNVVKNSETENKQSQEGVKQADNELKTAEQKTQTVQTEGKQINEGVEEGNQRLQQMEQNPAPAQADGTQAPTNPDGTPAAANQNGTPAVDNNDPLKTQHHMIENGGYTDAQKQNMNQSMDQIMNMKPGDTLQIGDRTYNMDQNGKLYSSDSGSSNVMEYDSKKFAAQMECSSQMGAINREREFAAEDAAMGAKDSTPKEGSDEFDEDTFEYQNKRIDKDYSAAEKTEITKARDSVANLKPGQSVQCGGNTYSMDDKGVILVNGEPKFERKDHAARYAANNVMNGIDSKKAIEQYKKQV